MTDDDILKMIYQLSDSKWKVKVPERLYSNFETIENVDVFHFTEKEFRELNLVLARPGLGTITDCIRYSIPLISFYENNNAEMIHNAERIKQIGIGQTLLQIEDVKTVITEELSEEVYEQRINSIMQRPIQGYQQYESTLSNILF